MDSVNIPQSEMKKKHIATSYYLVKEAVASWNIAWAMSHQDYTVLLTKALGTNLFNDFICELMH